MTTSTISEDIAMVNNIHSQLQSNLKVVDHRQNPSSSQPTVGQGSTETMRVIETLGRSIMIDEQTVIDHNQN